MAAERAETQLFRESAASSTDHSARASKFKRGQRELHLSLEVEHFSFVHHLHQKLARWRPTLAAASITVCVTIPSLMSPPDVDPTSGALALRRVVWRSGRMANSRPRPLFVTGLEGELDPGRGRKSAGPRRAASSG